MKTLNKRNEIRNDKRILRLEIINFELIKAVRENGKFMK